MLLDHHGIVPSDGDGSGRIYSAGTVHPTAEKLQERLRELGVDVEIRELDATSRTAAEAATAVGCDVAQIVKSLVFVVEGEAVLCLCAGDRRLRIERFGPDARMATADEARAATGFSVGGIPPLGHDAPLRTVVDGSLRRFDLVWCTAGTPRAVFPIETGRLLRTLADGEIADDLSV
jgi:prolyl-tRNA editing enzyme YbaK/EbsC (Cys-tRNA(Pro) deacylase)